jgi:hypothetical protein
MNGNGNEDFPYWEDNRTQPGGGTQQLETMQFYPSQQASVAPPVVFPPQQHSLPYQEVQRRVSPNSPEHPPNPNPTISVTAGHIRIDITITSV